MKIAKLFTHGRSQFVQLPKDFYFKEDEVYIKKVSDGVLLMSKTQSVWDLWEKNLLKYNEPFLIERNQPNR